MSCTTNSSNNNNNYSQSTLEIPETCAAFNFEVENNNTMYPINEEFSRNTPRLGLDFNNRPNKEKAHNNNSVSYVKLKGGAILEIKALINAYYIIEEASHIYSKCDPNLTQEGDDSGRLGELKAASPSPNFTELLVVEFEPIYHQEAGLLFRPVNFLSRTADGSIQQYALQWSHHQDNYFRLMEVELPPDQAAQLKSWPVGDVVYWVNPSPSASSTSPALAVYEFGTCTELPALSITSPMQYALIALLANSIEVQEPPLFCHDCRDYFEVGRACSHLWFCEKCEIWSSPQARCEHSPSETTTSYQAFQQVTQPKKVA